MLFKVRGIKIFWTGLGAFLTWEVYTAGVDHGLSQMGSILLTAAFVAFYAQIMARVNKTPSTVFLTACVMPVIPGAGLYYVMYWFTRNNLSAARDQAVALLLTCLSISLGFILVDITGKYLNLLLQGLKKYVARK